MVPTTSTRPAHPAAQNATSTADSRLEIEASRPRQTARPAAPFRELLSSGVSLLMSGAEVATHVVAGPVLAAAVHDARLGATAALAGPAAAIGGPAAAAAGAIGPGTGPLGTGAASNAMAAGAGTPGAMQAMMQDGQASNMQLLALQQQIQEESQRFSTISNVMRAKFDTAKAAVSNIRA
jgi:hypothetical protein